MLPAKARFARRDPVVDFRPLIARGIVAATISIGLAACGDEPSADEPGGTTGSDLTVTLDPDGPDGLKEPLMEDVSCDAPEEGEVCRAIARLSAADLGPVDRGQACTEIFGGPDRVEIVGTLNDDSVDVTLTRSNGCEIERFQQALPLLRALFPDYEPGASLGA